MAGKWPSKNLKQKLINEIFIHTDVIFLARCELFTFSNLIRCLLLFIMLFCACGIYFIVIVKYY